MSATQTPLATGPTPGPGELRQRRRRTPRPGVSPFERTRPAVRVLQYLVLAAYLVFLGFPLLWLLSTAFASPRDLVQLHPSLLPETPTLANFAAAFTEQALVRSAWNSLVIAIFVALLTILVALPAAYCLVRLRTWLTKPVTAWILLSQLFPFILLVIPIFLVLRQVGLVDTRAGLVLIHVVWILPFALWMLQGYVRELPGDIEEAAAVDGGTQLQILRHIVFPLLMPGIVATTLFAFITSWNEFFFALVLLKSPELQTLPLALARFVGLEGVARLGPLAAGALLATVPSLAFFSFIQRGLTGGLLAGATKG